MTRILFVEPTFPGVGADYKVHAQLVESARARHDVVAVSLSHADNPAVRTSTETDALHRLPITWVEESDSRFTRQSALVRNFPGAVRRSLQIAAEFRPDVIYSAQQRRDVLLAAIIATRTSTPRIVHLHTAFAPWLGRTTRSLIRRADHIVGVSEFVRETVVLDGVPGERVSTVHNLTAPVLAPTTARTSLRQQFGIANDTTVVAAVGRLDPGKGFDHLLHALSRVVTISPNVHLLVCGRSRLFPGFEDGLRQTASDLGLDGHVTFLGNRDDIADILAASDAFCLPAELEAFGLVFVEAMRAGLPVVGLHSGGVPEIVVDGVTGLLSYPGDQEGLARNLAAVVGNPDQARAMGRAGRHRLNEAFSPEVVSERWIRVVDGVITRHAK